MQKEEVMRRKFPSHKKQKIVQEPFNFPGNKAPRADKNAGLERFLRQRIKYLKKVRKHEFPLGGQHKKQRTIMSHSILALELTLQEWEKIKY